MKKVLIFILGIVTTFTNSYTQLSGQAQVLYDSAYNQDPALVNFAVSNGAQIIATPDNSSFYVQWFPTAAIPNETPVIVTLHGSEGNAFMEFNSWFAQANMHGCGIIALQWNRYNPNPPLDYFPDDTLYSYIDSALTNINYPSNKAMLHGFSRGSARSYALIFADIQSGNNYFCTTISNAGKLDLGYPLYNAINAGVYGTNVFAGKNWNLFCGPPDPPTSGGACDGMNFTKTWLEGQGATVNIYIQDSLLGHNGFQLPASFAYKDSMLNNYLECYATSSIFKNSNDARITIFPNPANDLIYFTFDKTKIHAVYIYNSLGQIIHSEILTNDQPINCEAWNSGLYFYSLVSEGETIGSGKLIIE